MYREHVILRMPRRSHRLLNPDALSSTRKSHVDLSSRFTRLSGRKLKEIRYNGLLFTNLVLVTI